MRPFISKINNADLYIGTKAGKRIEKEIENAKKSIRIVSPYIGYKQIQKLTEKANEGLYVNVVSSDDIGDFNHPHNSDFLRNIIYQKKTADFEALEKRKKLKLILIVLFFLSISLLGISLFSSFPLILKNSKILFKAIISIVVIFFIGLTIYKKWKIFTYSYYTPFPIRFIIDPIRLNETERREWDNNKFYHVKMYLIDDKKAFIGSVNLSSKGMYYNFESCITIEDSSTINDLRIYFDELMNSNCLEKDISYYGKRMYSEPIN